MNKAIIKLQTVYARGVNFFGQLGLNNGYKAAEIFTPIPGLERVEAKSIHASYAQSLCLLANGELLIWGWPLDVRSQMQIILMLNNNPRIPRFIQQHSPFPWLSLREGKDFPQKEAAALSEYEEVSIGGAFIVARDSEGRGYVWGNNHRGQCASGNYGYKAKPTLVESLLDKFITKVSAGYQHSLFLTMDGEVFGSGRIGNFAFGKVATELITYKSCIKSIAQVKIHGVSDMAAGQNHTLFLNELGKIFAVGKNEYGQCGQVSTKKYIQEVEEVYMPEKCNMIACGTKHSLALGASGTVYAFGSKIHGQIDGFNEGLEQEQSSPLPVTIPTNSKAIKIFAGFDRSAALCENGELWTWGGVDYSYLDGEFYKGMTLINPLIPKEKEDDITDIALGYMHTLVLTSM